MKYVLPKPIDPDIFEDLVCDIYSQVFSNPNLQRFGRKGQKQNGIDILGKDNNKNYLYAIQCKCHPNEVDEEAVNKEIDTELAKFDSSDIKIDYYIFVTSTNTSTHIQKHILNINEVRKKVGLCPVEVVFWDFLQKEVTNNIDLLHRYFFKLLPSSRLEYCNLPDLNKRNRVSLKLKTDDLANLINPEEIKDSLVANIKLTLGEPTFSLTSEYILYLGLHSNNTTFEGFVDLDLCLKDLFTDEDAAEDNLNKLVLVLNNICDLIHMDTRISKSVVIYSDSEISCLFLAGILLRRRKITPTFVFKDQAWDADNKLLTYVPSEIRELKPEIINASGTDVIFIFSCTGTFDLNTERDKINNIIKDHSLDVRFILGYSSNQVKNSAHAYSVAKDIASKLNSLNTWGIRKIHLILITPKPLAALVGYQLNTLNVNIVPYFLNKARDKYLSAGGIDNNLLR